MWILGVISGTIVLTFAGLVVASVRMTHHGIGAAQREHYAAWTNAGR